MAKEVVMQADGTELAGADLSAKQYYAVKLSTAADDTVLLVAAQTDDVYGILQNKPVSGAVAEVAIQGCCKAAAGAAITRGAKVMADTDGRLITWTSGAAHTVVGYAVESSAGAGALFTLRLGITPVVT